ncbi:SID1 transmembrane family member 1 isoform X4 [Pantherophis guttatus]|uniref:SID1 transmembrane family member 1 isoform X4 n=1 Tax=Pantherophis guttatus TaxID=94885 RepID=A0A6P9BFE1_PANGU|nr:SID1 transmembrane family member 1 isoform X4 [Pantherophis guttatus]
MSGWAGLAGLLLAVAGAQKQLLAPPTSLRPAAAEHAAQFDHVFNGTVNRGTERLYSFNYTSKAGQVDALRVTVKSDSEDDQYPVLFVVRQQKGVLSWQLPLIFHGLYQRSYNYTEVSRTLCPSESVPENGSSEQIVFINVASMAPYNAHYQLQVTKIKNFQLSMDTTFTFTASPSQPQKKDFPSKQFFVVFVIKPEDYTCGGSSPPSIQGKTNYTWNLQRMKHLEVTVLPSVKGTVYIHAILFSFLAFFSFYLGALVVGFVQYIRFRRKTSIGRLDDGPGTMASSHPITASTPEGSSYGAIDESSSSGGQELSTLDRRPPCGSDTDSSVEEESDFDTMPEIESNKNVIRTKMFLYLSDLSRKDRRIVSKKYKIYFWNIITIAVFYALPVVQLVITYQTVVNVTGNQDICYYNFLCAHPLGVLSAFNNILSNIGHMLLGVLFLLIVLCRDLLHRRSLEMKDTCAMEYGIPKHFGLFYAMGVALMMEGVLSACYHVCPNYTNFQFDTSFMYMIAGLCMLKLYQTRHPDINASAYSAYASFAVVICLAVLGVVFGKNVWFWVLFSIIHVVASLGLSTQIYYMGRFKIDVSDPDLGVFRRIAIVLYTDYIQQCSRPMYMDRMILLVVGNLVNWSFAIFGLVYRPRDFASYMLGIFICNLLLYLAFYVIMKLRSSEKLLPFPLFCIVATAVVWASALYFFFQNPSSWEETPAQSREKNRPCILLGFFDDHDIWHFLSAAALFFSFLGLLTLDDDLDSVPRNKIPVF